MLAKVPLVLVVPLVDTFSCGVRWWDLLGRRFESHSSQIIPNQECWMGGTKILGLPLYRGFADLCLSVLWVPPVIPDKVDSDAIISSRKTSTGVSREVPYPHSYDHL